MADTDIPIYVNPDNGLSYSWTGDTANCTIEFCPAELSIYGYRPNIGFTSFVIAGYGVGMLVHIYLGIRYKKWGFMGAMVAGCIVEILGYAGRILYNQNPWADAGFLLQIIMITIAPVFFAAAIYVLIYQIAMYISAESSRFKPVFFYWIFITCDIISLILQATGGAMSSTSNGDSDVGVNIALAGLIFQVITLVFFIVCVVDYMWCSRRVWRQYRLPNRFLVFCAFLALATTLILIRCAFRVYELSEGYSEESEALRDEPMFNGLEGMMVLLAAWCLVIAHPGFIFKENASLTKDAGLKRGTKETIAPYDESA